MSNDTPNKKVGQTFAALFTLIVIVPNFLAVGLMAGGAGAASLIVAVALSFYYLVPAYLFQKTDLFLTETVIMPQGAAGIFVSAAIYSIPFIFYWYARRRT